MTDEIEILTLRPATPGDADQVADVYLRSRKELLAFAPLAHSDETFAAGSLSA